MHTTACALAAIVFALGAPTASAAAPMPSDLPEGTFIVYSGTATHDELGPDGEVTPMDDEQVTLTISCVADGACTSTGWPWQFAGDEVPYSGPGSSWSLPLEGDWCDASSQRPARTVTVVSATATQLVGTVDIPPSGWVTCSDGDMFVFGAHFELTLDYVEGAPCVIEAVTCIPGAVAAPTPTPSGAAAPVVLPGRTGDAPSVLSTLATPAQTLSLPQCALAVVLAVILALLMGFPTHLLSKVSDDLGGRVAAWWGRIRPRPAAADAGSAPIRSAPTVRGWWPAAVGVLLAALITSFIDPQFGFDAASLRQFGSIAIGFAVDVVLGWFVLIWVVGRLHPQATARFEFRPLTLLIVVATVVFSRLTGFQPGIAFGLVAGVAFGTAIATASAKARLTLITLGWGLALALLGWMGFTLLQDAGDALGVVFARETLAALTAAGVSSLPIALLPARGLTGATLFAWNRWAWGAAYVVGLLAFFLVLLPMPGSWAEVPFSLWTWAGMYAVYAAVALGLWLAVTRPWQRTRDH